MRQGGSTEPGGARAVAAKRLSGCSLDPPVHSVLQRVRRRRVPQPAFFSTLALSAHILDR
jgi:hypothetical protein